VSDLGAGRAIGSRADGHVAAAACLGVWLLAGTAPCQGADVVGSAVPGGPAPRMPVSEREDGTREVRGGRPRRATTGPAGRGAGSAGTPLAKALAAAGVGHQPGGCDGLASVARRRAGAGPTDRDPSRGARAIPQARRPPPSAGRGAPSVTPACRDDPTAEAPWTFQGQAGYVRGSPGSPVASDPGAASCDILDIPIAAITDEYLRYLALMQELDLDVAGEFC